MVTSVLEKPVVDLTKPITGDELYAMSHVESAELVKGAIVQRMPTGYLHGLVESLITALLFNFVRKNRLVFRPTSFAE